MERGTDGGRGKSNAADQSRAYVEARLPRVRVGLQEGKSARFVLGYDVTMRVVHGERHFGKGNFGIHDDHMAACDHVHYRRDLKGLDHVDGPRGCALVYVDSQHRARDRGLLEHIHTMNSGGGNAMCALNGDLDVVLAQDEFLKGLSVVSGSYARNQAEDAPYEGCHEA